MRFSLLPLILLAGPAAAHTADLPHVHASDAGAWLALSAGLAAIAAAGLMARAQHRSRADRRRK